MQALNVADAQLRWNSFGIDAPVARVCGREVPVPYAAHMEEAALPQAAAIDAAARRLVRPQ